jgi:hypothetical protein
VLQRPLRWQHAIKFPAYYSKRGDIFPITPEPTGPAQPREAFTGPVPLQEAIDGLADEIALGAPHLAGEGLEALAFLAGEIDLGAVH